MYSVFFLHFGKKGFRAMKTLVLFSLLVVSSFCGCATFKKEAQDVSAQCTDDLCQEADVAEFVQGLTEKAAELTTCSPIPICALARNIQCLHFKMEFDVQFK